MFSVMNTALWKKIQSFVGVAADGIPGDITAAAVAAKLGIVVETPAPVPGNMVFDNRSETNIATLLPAAQAMARQWLRKCLDAGINVRIICGNRTYQEQDALYAQGRTAAGAKVTNAPAGYSWHNFGVAWDFVVFDANGEPQWESPLMEKCGRVAESLGLEWGGSWTSFQDTPHIQLKGLPTLAETRELVNGGKWNPA